MEKIYICERCGKVCNSKSQLGGHKTIHYEKSNHTCPYCGKEFFSSVQVFKTHITIQHGKVREPKENIEQICRYCGKVCKNENSLRNHERLCKQNPNRQEMNWSTKTNRTPESYKNCRSGTKGKRCYTNGETNIYLAPDDVIPEGFVKGCSQKKSNSNIHTIQITKDDESESKYIPKEQIIPDGWHRGKPLAERKYFISLFGPAFINNGYIAYYEYKNGNPIIKYEHIKVMEQVIGREVTSEEVVHHIDRNRKNNSIDNLMLFKNDHEHAHYHATGCKCNLIMTPDNNYICD